MKICIQTGDVIDRIGAKKGYALFKKQVLKALTGILTKPLELRQKIMMSLCKTKNILEPAYLKKASTLLLNIMQMSLQ